MFDRRLRARHTARTDKNGCTHFSSDGDLEVKKYDAGKVVIMAEGY